MTVRVLGAVIVVAAAGYTLAKLGRFLRAKWFLVRLWLWLSGEAHHGQPITDAGWFRPGQNALTRTGHATRFWHLPRWKRAAWRTGGTLAVVAVVACLLVNPLITGLAIICICFVFSGLAAWLGVRRLLGRKQERTWLLPLHLAAHELAGWPRAHRAASWIKDLELDAVGAVLAATLELPQGWPADDKDKQRLVAIAGTKLGIEAAEPSWRLAGPAPLLTLRHSPPPPGHIKLVDVLDEMRKCKPDELLIGIGKNDEMHRASLGTDSPHIMLSMGTGAGKSNLAGFLLLQRLIRGDIGLILDAKRRMSYPWLLKDMDENIVQLPNIAYAWTTAQLHRSMAWLDTELERRGDVAFTGMDTRGKVHANVGARLFTIAEELNYAVPKLKAYWQENRQDGDPAKSPAFTGLGSTAFAGRAVFSHLVLVGQMLTAEATGSRDSSVKENCGIKMLSRYGPKGWRVVAEDVPMPPPSDVTGRVQLVTSGSAREVQVPELDPELARQMVLDGIISPLPYGMPCGPARPVTVSGAPELESRPGPAPVTVSVSPPQGPVGLKEAAASGELHPGTTLGALRMARFRGELPESVGQRGAEYLYELAELVLWDAGRR
jgi:hypothetical protein